MNRIYQGKVTKAEIFDEVKDQWFPRPDWSELLWQHHELFQDAVNYYSLCLLSLATSKESQIYPIRETLNELDGNGVPTSRNTWMPFKRNGVQRPGMLASVAPYVFPQKGSEWSELTPEDFYKEILKGNPAKEDVLSLALDELLHLCAGDGQIKKQGRALFPLFCNPNSDATGPFSEGAIKKAIQSKELPDLLAKCDGRKAQEALAAQIELGWVVKLNLGAQKLESTEAKDRLVNAANFFLEKLKDLNSDSKDRARQFLGIDQSKSKRDLEELKSEIAKLAQPPVIPRNRKGDKAQVNACLLFKYFPSDFTHALMSALFPKKEKKEKTKAPKKVGKATKQDRKRKPLGVISEAEPVKAAETAAERFRRFGDDAIILARGERGFVFPAFTSLGCWEKEAPSLLAWTEFDIAAFKEALKTFNQIQNKGTERKAEQSKIQKRLDCMDGKSAWEVEKTEGDGVEAGPPLLKGDPRIVRLEEILRTDLSASYDLTDGEEVEYGLTRRTIRGFSDLKKRWEKIAPTGTEFSEDKKDNLRSDLKAFQAENSEKMGSAALFEKLAEEKNWIIWQTPKAETLKGWRTAAQAAKGTFFTDDPLKALVEKNDLEERATRLGEPIRFTPADPIHSRRQFLFSDVCNFTPRGEFRFIPGSQEVWVPFVFRNGDRKFQKRRIKIVYSAPRKIRDGLRVAVPGEVLSARHYLNPMLAALDLPEVAIQDFSEGYAVALMPDVDRLGRRRFLLNFPINIESESIISQVGKKALWEKQFVWKFEQGGSGEFFYLQWPATAKDTKKKSQPKKWWWERDQSVTALGVDLGQRDAGAFALLEVKKSKKKDEIVRAVGSVEKTTWYAKVLDRGMLRLRGEDARVLKDGKWEVERYGERGRSATPDESKTVLTVMERLGIQPTELFPNGDVQGFSYPEQNDQLLSAFKRAQKRLALLQSISWQIKEETNLEKIKERLKDRTDLPNWLLSVYDPKWVSLVRAKIEPEIESLRTTLGSVLPVLATRILPQRHFDWEWVKREVGQTHVLRRTDRKGASQKSLKIMGQRGISMERIEQLEGLRRCAQSLNRALAQTPGEKSLIHRFSDALPDPCPEILDKMDVIRKERVNQTAHLILAQALGVRLKKHTKSAKERVLGDFHGEYEKFREPVDFIVLEDLFRYKASQGRSKRENSRLMAWCHRAILDKVKELCEVFGIPVLETNAAYSSKFSALTGVAGFRAEEVSLKNKSDWYWKKQLSRFDEVKAGTLKVDKDEMRKLELADSVFQQLEFLNSKRKGKPPITLLVPRQGGPLFISMKDGEAVHQADMNAAVNLALRAVAAPDAHEIFLKIPSVREDGDLFARAVSKREEARWGRAPIKITLNKKPKEGETDKLGNYPNFFVDLGGVAWFGGATLEGRKDLKISSGQGIWHSIRRHEWHRAMQINIKRLNTIGDEGKKAAKALEVLVKGETDDQSESETE